MENYYADISRKIKETFFFYSDPKQLVNYSGDIVKIILIILIAIVAVRLSNVLVEKFFLNRKKFKMGGEDKRYDTLKGIIKSITRYTIYFVAFTPILAILGINVSSLLAAAGIGGLAIGFGAQSLVKDGITGFFILLEGQFQIGDYIEIGGKSGIVEEMSLRVTRLKDFNGDIHIIPNGLVDKVTNKSKGDMRAWVDISISFEENIDNALEVLGQICKEISAGCDKIVEGPTVLGVTKIGDFQIVLSIVARTVPMEQWAVERLIRKRIKEAFDEKGIVIPYPTRVILQKDKC